MNQNQKNEIDLDSFKVWLEDPVTKHIFNRMEEEREKVNTDLINANLIMSPRAQVKLAMLVGVRNGIDLFLQIQYSDLEEIIDSGNEDSTSWSSATSSS